MRVAADTPAWRKAVPLMGAVAIYLLLGCAQLQLPGLQYDEAADAVPAMEWVLGKTPSTLSTIRVGGATLPGMMLHHIGPTSVWTSALGFALFGVSVETLRAAQLSIGGLAVLLAWALARRWFGLPVAHLTAWLCATHPAMVWWSRAGANWTVPLLPIALGMMLALTAWWRTKRFAALAFAAFLFGLGVMTKILFLWLAPVLVVLALAAQSPRAWVALAHQMGAARLAALAAAACLGALPLILHNVPNLDTVQFVLRNAGQTRIYGHDNLNFAGNLQTVLGQWLRMIGGDTLAFEAPAGLWPAGALLWLLAVLTGLRHLRNSGNGLRFLALAPLLILPMSTVSTSSIGATYVFVLAPFALMLLAWALRKFERSRIGPPVTWRIAALALVASQIATNAQVHAFFAQTGGRAWWSDVIYDVNRELSSQSAGRRLVALDWGFARNIALLSQGRVQMRELFEFQPEPPPGFDALCAGEILRPGALFIAHDERIAAFRGRVAVCERVAFKRGFLWREVRRFAQRDGAPNTVLYEAVPMPPITVLPEGVAARNAVIGGNITLLGGSVNPGEKELEVRLFWRAGEKPVGDDVVLLHVVNEQTGAVIVAADQKPRAGFKPLPTWSPGEIVEDRHWIAIPGDMEPGTYQVRVGLYDESTRARRPIGDPLNDAAGDSLRLTSFAWP